MKTRTIPGAALAAALLVAGPALAQDEQGAYEAPAADTAALVADAESAAPASITANATIKDWEGNVLREGTNGYACMPTPPGAPQDGPMCLDGPWQALISAWAEKSEPAIDEIGIAYMLGGDFGASNSDPFAAGPDAVDDWVDAGHHLMIVLPDASGYETVSTDPTTGEPWVMWKGTPYAHIMVPIDPAD